MTEPLAPGAVIGILGGGQLGRMLSVAAARLGLRTIIYDPSSEPPAGQVAEATRQGAWDDTAALSAFARDCAVVTYEFENIPAQALDALEAGAPVYPPRAALATSQDRLDEKTFLTGLGLHTAPFADITDLASLEAAVARLGRPSILKTRRLGYDGKGQVRINEDTDLGDALASLAGAPAILEGFIPFTAEISVIGARGQDGRTAAFDPGENTHAEGILRTTRVPASAPSSVRTDAVLATAKILSALDYVGVIGVEFFVTPAGLLVNEFAPRVHNSGHWTQNGCLIDQFEQHIRAIAGWPLGDGARHSDIEMENLIGDDMDRLPALAAEGCAIHLYGKAETRPGRKMGHVNRLLKR